MASKLFEWQKISTNDYLDHYEIEKDNSGTWVDVGTNTLHEWINITEGLHTIKIRGVNGKNEYSNVLEWSFEGIAELIVNKDTIDFEYTTNTSKTFEWSLSSGSLDHYEIQLDSGGWITNETTTAYNWNSLTIDTHTLEVKAIDIAGNENIISWSFEVIDNISINKVSMIDDTYPWNKIFTWELASGSLDHYEISKDEGITWEVVGTNISYTWNDISDGTQTFIVKGIDIVGDEDEIQWDFTISVEPIVISKVTPDFPTLTL